MAQWKYELPDKGWLDYGPAQNTILETNFQRGNLQFNFFIGNTEYKVDLSQMEQYQVGQPDTVMKILRFST